MTSSETSILQETIDESAEYWDEHFTKPDKSVDRLLSYYADRRLEIFGRHIEHPSLELGPGIGEFAEKAGITHVLDVPRESLKRVQKRLPGIVASHYTDLPLPYAAGSLRSMVCSDVLHHVKETIPLTDFSQEAHRVLAEDGLLLVADRRPTLLNRLFLVANQIGRALYLKLAPGRSVTSGDVELPMEKSDYAALYVQFEVVSVIGYRSLPMVLVNAASFFLSLVVPARYLSGPVFTLFAFCERRLPVLMMDHLLVLRRRTPE